MSHGILSRVHRIPRRTWRFALLGGGALTIVVLMVLACVKLYEFSTPSPSLDVAESVAESDITITDNASDVSTATTTPSSVPTKTEVQAAAQPRTVPAKPGEMRAIGLKVPALYID